MSKKKKSSRSRKKSSSLRLQPDRSEEQAASSPPPLSDRDHFLEEIPWEEALDDGDYLELPSYGRTNLEDNFAHFEQEEEIPPKKKRKKSSKRTSPSGTKSASEKRSPKRTSSEPPKKDSSPRGERSRKTASSKKRSSGKKGEPQEQEDRRQERRSKKSSGQARRKKGQRKGDRNETAPKKATSGKSAAAEKRDGKRPPSKSKSEMTAPEGKGNRRKRASAEEKGNDRDSRDTGKRKKGARPAAADRSTSKKPKTKPSKKKSKGAERAPATARQGSSSRKSRAGKKQRSGGFAELGLSETMLDSLEHAEYLEPTPIQSGIIPDALKGIDLMGQARTGTGKTAAFAIPILEGLDECEPGETPVALALVPTRELAVQVRDETAKLAHGRDARVLACYGGKPIRQQIHRLREGADIIIGTPGRVLDLLRRNSLILDDLQWVVLDEADRMLDIGFRPDIEKILRRCPSERQTLLLSATLPPPVVRLAKQYMKDPEVLDFSETDVAGDTIDQYYITVDPRRKFDALLHLLQQEEPKQAIIFTRTKRGADRLHRLLEKHHRKIGVIHGDLSQSVRDRVMDRFRKDRVQLLVATDVVGRGIDITSISHIINYDIPQFSDDYIHRVGRTGRMGREGTAYTFVGTDQGIELTRIEKRINRLLKRVELKGFEAFANPASETKSKEDPKPVFGRPVRRIRRAL